MPTGWTPAAASSTLEEWTRTYSRGQQCSCFRTRNTFCRTRSLSNATFFHFFDQVMKIWWFYTEIWRYIDFQNGGRPPSSNCLTTHEVSVKFYVNLIHRSEDIAVWIWLEMLIQFPKIGVLGDFGPLTVIIRHRDPQTAHPCVNPRLLSYQL